jgi:hypothetical protein
MGCNPKSVVGRAVGERRAGRDEPGPGRPVWLGVTLLSAPSIAPQTPRQTGRPGHRFRDRYEVAQRRQPARSAAARYAVIAGAGLCFALGLLLIVTPGPALPFLLAGAGMLATISRRAARWLDFTENRVRWWGRRLTPRWTRRAAGWSALGGAVGALAPVLLYLNNRYTGGG